MKKRLTIVGMLFLAISVMVGYDKNQQITAKEEETKPEGLTLYIVRHGGTTLDMTGCIQGWSDTVLTPEDGKVVTVTGIGLKSVAFQNAYSSGSDHALQATQLVLDQNEAGKNLEVVRNPDLREFNFGSYGGDLNETIWQDTADDQGVSLEEFMKNMAPESSASSIAKLDQQCEEGRNNWPAEDYVTVTKRLKKGLGRIVTTESANSGNDNVLTVSHGLSISALLATLFGGFKALKGGLKDAGVTTIYHKNGEYTLDKVNDVSHLETGEKESKWSKVLRNGLVGNWWSNRRAVSPTPTAVFFFY